MSYTNWRAYAHRLKPFDGDLIPVFENGKRIEGAVKDHSFSVKDILAFDNVRAIELRTSKELMCIDFDSLEAISCFHRPFLSNIPVHYPGCQF